MPKFPKPGWISALAAVVVAACTLYGVRLAHLQLDLPEPPEWTCASFQILGGALRDEDDTNMAARPLIRWQDQSGNPRVKGYRLSRYTEGDGHRTLSALIPPDVAFFVDRTCRGDCSYRVVTVSLSGRDSRMSQPVLYTVNWAGTDWESDRQCDELPQAVKEMARARRNT